jgi:hypothetical protein
MNFRLTAILLSSIIVVGVILLVLTFSGDGDSVPTDVLMEELTALKPEDIDVVELEREDGTKLKFVRPTKDRWDVEWDAATASGGKHHFTARADAGAVGGLVSDLLKAKPTAHPELSTNPAAHGLAPPGLKVTLRQGAERSSTINFGDVTSGGKAVAFVTTSARPNRPLATPRSGVDSLFRSTGGMGKAIDLAKWASDFRVKNVFGDTNSIDTVSSVTLGSKGKTLGLARAGTGWEFTAPSGWGAADLAGDDRTAPPTAITGVSQLINTLTNLQAGSAADFVEAPTKEQLKEHGLEEGNPDVVRVEIVNRNNEKQVAFIGKREAAAPAAPPLPGSPPPSEKVWVRVEGQPGVIRANAPARIGGLAPVIDNPDPLRDRTLLAFDRARIDGIDITGGVTLRNSGNEWKLYGPPTPAEPQPTNAQAVNRILEVLTERRSIRTFLPVSDANFPPNATQAEVKVWADGFEDSADPKTGPKQRDKAQPVTLLFGKSEGDSVFVRRVMPDGAKADFMLPAKLKIGLAATEPVSLVESVKKTRLDLLNASLKSFAPEVANKITVTGTANYELVREDGKDGSASGDRWTYAAPADKKGQVADSGAVTEMLRVLGTTNSVTRFVNEMPDEAALVSYGFAAPKAPAKDAPPSPRLKVVVGLKSETDKERIYEFGTPTADPNFVHARQAGKAAVFTVPRLVHDTFATPDLRDRQIFHFDVAAVTGVELKGWGKSGKITELHAEKGKDGVWVTKSPPTPAGFVLDPAKLTTFLDLLARTRVKSFVPGTATHQHGFGNEKEYLQIVLKSATGPILALNLGAATPDGQAFFGWTAALPQTAPLYTVEAATFRKYKDGIAAFAR